MTRSIRFLGLFAAGMLAFAQGCGSTTATTSGGGQNQGGGGQSQGGGGTNPGGGGNNPGGGGTNPGGGGSGNTGNTGDGNDSFEEAIELEFVDGVAGLNTEELDPLDGDLDYFRFEGTAGQAVYFLTDAKPDADPYADGYPDLVITLYDAAQNQIAENDDPIPRNTQDSSFITVLPATGTYYIRVSEFCWSWPEGPLGAAPCDAIAPEDFESYGYAINVLDMDPAAEGNILESEPNNDSATATDWEFAPATDPGTYYAQIGWGTFTAANDEEWFAYVPPADLAVAEGRPTAGFTFSPTGATGNGSTADVGTVDVIDAATMNVIARMAIADALDPTFGAEISVPVDLSQGYFLKVTRDAGGGANDFWTVFGTLGGSNPVEELIGGVDDNDDVATSDVAEGPFPTASGGQGYFVSGNLVDADVDVYEVPTGLGMYFLATCGAKSQGSGIDDLTIEVLDGMGTPISGASAVEVDATGNAVVANIDATNDPQLYVRITKSGQVAGVAGNYYSCGFVFGDEMVQL